MTALGDARRVVIKIGSALVIDETTGAADAAWLASLARDAAAMRARGQQVLIVSSGSAIWNR